MAQIIEEAIVIKVSKLVKSSTGETLVPMETLLALEQVAQELLGDGVIVEIAKT